MLYTAYIAAPLALVALLLATGWWRLALAPLGIRPDRMTANRLGLLVPAEHVDRVDAILASFAGGFNAMVASPSASGWERYCESRSPLCRPFAHEGAAMGYTLRRLFRYRPSDFERQMLQQHGEFCYLHYVGLGFWSGMRNHDAKRVARVVDGLDPLYRWLCYDGYGFKYAFFDYPKDPAALRIIDSLDGYARNTAYQGVGRALFFYFMQEPDVLIGRLDNLGDYAADAAAGVGLAAVFIFHDRLEFALDVAAALPARWHDDVHLGMCFGLKARSINDPRQFSKDLACLPRGGQEAVRAALAECDRAEARVRGEPDADEYRRWRTLAKQWMTGHIEYPLTGVISSGSEALCRQTAAE